MSKKLVIVESPSKSKTIEKYLGSEYKVVSSLGHIRDLATTGKYGFGIDIENNFKPNYEIIKGKKKLVNELKKDEQVIILALIGANTLKDLFYTKEEIVEMANLKLREIGNKKITQELLKGEV